MKLTPAIKGQLTKAFVRAVNNDNGSIDRQAAIVGLRNVFARHMPRQQAKHTARKYFAGLVASHV